MSALSYPCIFRAHELVLTSWRSNAVGLVNFQNPRAVVNTRSLMEVLMSAAVSNAAGRGERAHGFVSFIGAFGEELGIPYIPTAKFADDPIISNIVVPKFIFPGPNHLLSKNRYLGSLDGILGTAERQVDDEGIDLLVQAIGSSLADSVRYEAKDGLVFGTVDVVEAVSKLMRGTSNVGVLVLRRCNLYWGDESLNAKNRHTPQRGLELISKIGKAYLISSSGEVETLVIHKNASSSGRLILLQVPEFQPQ